MNKYKCLDYETFNKIERNVIKDSNKNSLYSNAIENLILSINELHINDNEEEHQFNKDSKENNDEDADLEILSNMDEEDSFEEVEE